MDMDGTLVGGMWMEACSQAAWMLLFAHHVNMSSGAAEVGAGPMRTRGQGPSSHVGVQERGELSQE